MASHLASAGGADGAAVIGALVAAVCGGAALTWLARYPLLRFRYGIVPRFLSPYEDSMDGWDLCPAGAGSGAAGSLLSLPPAMLDLTVDKIHGRRRPVRDCVLSLEDLRDVIAVDDVTAMGKLKRQIREKWGWETAFYDYTVTHGRKSCTVLLFEDGGTRVALLLEPEEGMMRILTGMVTQ